MMKTITHFISSSGGARHSFASSALLILLSFLMLLPGVARAEGDDSEDATLSLVEAYPTGENGKEACNLFDGNTSTDWEFNFPSRAYVIFKASMAIVVDGYTITSGSESSYFAGLSSQNPRSWTLSGSNDLKSWTVIGQVSSDRSLQDKNSTPTDFVCSSNDTFYKYFKWEITEARSNVQISEFSLKPKAITCPGHQIEKVEAKAATCVDMGNIEYYKCSICQQAFKDEAGSDVYTDDSYVFAATGHDWQGDRCSTCGIGALKYIETEGGVAITGFEKGYSTSQLVIPATHDGKQVVAIGTSAFFYNASIESVEIPSSVQTIGELAFGKCTSLSAVTFVTDSKLETIGKSAFSNTKLSNIEIPSSVTELGDESFLNCAELSSVTFPSDCKLEVIGTKVFMQSNLSQIEIPSSLKKIGAGAFLYCSNLSTITFLSDGNLKEIGESAFSKCESLSSIEIPASVEIIGNYAFSDTKIASVTFATNSNLKKIGERTFESTRLTSIELPASLETIGYRPFAYCHSLNYIYFKRTPSSVDDISGYNCNSLDNNDAKICVSKDCADIYRDGLSNYADRILGTFESKGLIYGEGSAKDGLTCIGFSGDSPSSLDIPSMVDGTTVIAIGNGAFQKTSLESVQIPASVETIGKGFAANCKSLTSVTFCRVPIGDNGISGYNNSNMFYNCNQLATVNVPSGSENAYKTQLNLGDNITITGQDITSDGLKFMVNAAMDGLVCIGFSSDVKQNLVIPEKVQDLPVVTIADKAFYENKTLVSVNIPASVVEIGISAFESCKFLSSVTMPANSKLQTIGDDAFFSTLLTEVFIPASVKTIGGYAFSSTPSLSSVSFANNGVLATIKNEAFSETGLQKISIPASVETIGTKVFSLCRKLETVIFNRPVSEDQSLTCDSEIFNDCANLKTIYVPWQSKVAYVDKLQEECQDKVKGMLVNDYTIYEVNDAADGASKELACIGFSDMGKTSVTLDEVEDMSVTEIKENAFLGDTFLTKVSLGSSVKKVGSQAFAGCEKVESIMILGDNATIEHDAFHNMAALQYIIVPNGAYDTYKVQGFENANKLVGYTQNGNLTLTDEKGLCELTNPSIYVSNALSYSRNVETDKGEYATVCLPFAIKLSETNDVFEKVYVPLNTMIHDQAHSDDTKESFILMLKEQAADAEIPANQPMIVKLADGKDEFTFTNSEDAKLSKDLMPSAISMTVLDWDGTSGLMTENRQFDISYCSLYQAPIPANANMNIWSFNDNGTFGPQTDGMLNPFRLFLHVDGLTAATQAKAYSFSIGVSDGTITGIREIISADTIGAAGLSLHDGVIYDLNGRKVTTADRIKSLPKGIYILNGKKMVVK